MPPGSSLSINTIRKADLKRLKGLDTLPLSSLALRWLSVADLTQVPLPACLSELRVWHSNKLVSLAGLEAARDLETLALRGNGPLQDATALHQLPKLQSFSIEGDPMTLQQIATLDFLDGLSLCHLVLRAVDGATLDLGPVARLSTLKKIDLHGPNFAPKELAKVAAAHPKFFDTLMDLPDCETQGTACKSCGGTMKELFIKGEKGLWCPSCDETGLNRALSDFRALVATATK